MNRKIVPVLDKSLNQIAKKKLEELKNNKELFESLPNHFKENFEKSLSITLQKFMLAPLF